MSKSDHIHYTHGSTQLLEGLGYIRGGRCSGLQNGLLHGWLPSPVYMCGLRHPSLDVKESWVKGRFLMGSGV